MKSLPFNIIFKGLIVLLLVLLLWDNRRIRGQNERLGKDISGLSVALQTSVDTTRNGFGQMKATTQTIVLSQEQANNAMKGELAMLKQRFDVRLRDVKSYSQIGTKYLFPINVAGRDTVIYNNKETVYYTSYGNLYTNGDSLLGVLSINDTVRILISKGRREQWWKVWKKRPLVTNAFMSSPNGAVMTLKSILVE